MLNLFRFVRDIWPHGETEPAPWRNRLTLPWIVRRIKFPERCEWLIGCSRREHLGVQTEVAKAADQGEDSLQMIWCAKEQSDKRVAALEVAEVSRTDILAPDFKVAHATISRSSRSLINGIQESSIMLTADKVAFLLSERPAPTRGCGAIVHTHRKHPFQMDWCGGLGTLLDIKYVVVHKVHKSYLDVYNRPFHTLKRQLLYRIAYWDGISLHN